jgi:hypothetical protein
MSAYFGLDSRECKLLEYYLLSRPIHFLEPLSHYNLNNMCSNMKRNVMPSQCDMVQKCIRLSITIYNIFLNKF